jgi:23S rRNA pseudouridine1911/1915/1917 synthase
MDLLARRLGSSRTKIKQLVKNRTIKVNGSFISRPDLELAPGDLVEIGGKEPPSKIKTKSPFPVLYQDEYLIAAEKPARILSISSETEKINTFYRIVSDYVKRNDGEGARIFIVHRLDREASGVMLFTKNKEIKDALQKDWDKSEKLYYAVVEGTPVKEEDTIKGWLCENKAHIVYKCREDTPGAQYAITRYRLIKGKKEFSLLEVGLLTGRKNQIRVHLADTGLPILGDKKYGAKEKAPLKAIALHAHSLSFTHPASGKRITVKSPMPAWFSRYL